MSEPRRWDFPPAPPGHEVSAVTDRYGHLWLRSGDHWEPRGRSLTGWRHLLSWSALFENFAPLTDATASHSTQPGEETK